MFGPRRARADGGVDGAAAGGLGFGRDAGRVSGLSDYKVSN